MISSEQSSSQNSSWKKRYGIIYTYAFVVLGNIIISLGPLIPIKAKAGGHQETDYSLVFTFRGIGYVTGSLIVSKLQKIYDAHKMISIYSVLIAVLCFLNGSETSVYMNSIQWFLIGMCCSQIEVLTQVSITVIFNQDVNLWMQALHFGFGVGAFISPLLITAFGTNTMLLLGVMSLINAFLTYRQISPKIQEQQASGASPKQTKQETPNSLVKIVCIFFLIDVGLELSYGGWIPTYCTMTGITSQKSAGISASIFWVAMTVGRLIAIPASKKFKVQDQLKFLSFANLGAMCFCVLTILVNRQVLAVYLGSALIGLSVSAVFPLLMSIPGALGFYLSPSNAATFTVMGSAGQSVIPVFFGFLINLFGPNTLYYLCFLIGIGMVVLYFQIIKFKPKSQKQRPLLQMDTLSKL